MAILSRPQCVNHHTLSVHPSIRPCVCPLSVCPPMCEANLGSSFSTALDGICKRSSCKHIEAETKWPPYCRQHFQMHFLEWKYMNFNYNFTEIYSQGPFNNIPALLQIMSWWWPGDKPLSESMMVSLPTHICIIQPQWIKIKAWIINYIHSFVWDIYNSLAKLPLTLTHWGRVMHICVDKLTIIGSDSGLSPGRRQAIIWTSAGILLIRHIGTNISEI